MQHSSVKWPVIIGLVLATTSCGSANKVPENLLDISTGPDASRVALGKELQSPASYASLPVPDATAGNLSGAVLVAAQNGDAGVEDSSSSGNGLFARLFGGLFN